jgi:preprotein translocase subunit SecA
MVTNIINRSLAKVFGSRNDRLIKAYRERVVAINALEPAVRKLTDIQLRAKTGELRQRLANGEADTAVLPEAFAIMREAMDRHIGLRNVLDPKRNFNPELLSPAGQELFKQTRGKCAKESDWRFVEMPPELYEAIRAAVPEARPPYRARPFDVQLIGGMVLYEGKIAEMSTGEGKTFVAPLACYLMALRGMHCHVVTVNDYLVRRDAAWVAPAFYALGLSVGYIQAHMDNDPRSAAYKCNVTYGTSSEFGFDYLRDNMKQSVQEQVQGPLDFAIVDEVDSILIDEARTPLIISGPAHDDSPRYRAVDDVVRKILACQQPWQKAKDRVDAIKRRVGAAEGEIKLNRGDKEKIKEFEDIVRNGQAELVEAEAALANEVCMFEVELDRKSVHLTHEGTQKAQEFAGVGSFYIGSNMDWPHLLEQSLRAHVVYECDKDYVVQNDEVVIVDEFTGRLMVGRQWSDGLHQAVEAKERVTVKPETQTMATITLQNFFKLYKRLAGMTGTAMTESEEFSKIYSLEVVAIPTNRPVARDDNEDLIFISERGKWKAIGESIAEAAARGQPVLVGTTSVEKSERLSKMLTRDYGLEHEVLNAKNHEREADIIAKAGQQVRRPDGTVVGSITIATNMAGRGTDISLGEGVAAVGGLFVLGTERHESRRIDNQLRGRAGRQGDPGVTRFYLSLEDDLMKLFAGDFTLRALQRLGMQEDEAIEHPFVSKAVERAQKKVEERNFGIRKNLLEYDEVRNFQRTYFYKTRQEILEGRNLQEKIFEIISEAVADSVKYYLDRDYVPGRVADWAQQHFHVTIDAGELRDTEVAVLEMTIKDKARDEARSSIYQSLSEFLNPDAQAEDWDYVGLSNWVKTQFDVQISPADCRKMDRQHIAETLVERALDQIEHKTCTDLSQYLVSYYGYRQLCNWAQEKFELDIPLSDIQGKTAAQVEDILLAKARALYQDRELAYPLDYAMMVTDLSGGTSNVFASEQLSGWLKAKYAIHMTGDEIRAIPADKVRETLLAKIRPAVEEIDKAVREAVEKLPESKTLAAWVTDRFATPAAPDEFEGEPPEERIERITELAKAFLRIELTELERNVLLQIYDTAWKDHLYAMDQLRDTIGLRGIAQRDPVIEYKREGTRLFEEFLRVLRDRVTDTIFKIKVASPEEMRNVYAAQQEVFDPQESTGVEAGRFAAPAPAAEEPAQEEEIAPVATIVNAEPKVGRNDPCPCGSGRKYKQCCGKTA